MQTVTQEQVLLAAREESKSTILVYASEEAMNAPRENLTPALCVSLPPPFLPPPGIHVILIELAEFCTGR